VASGASPTLPGIPGQDLPGVFTIRTLAEFERLQARLQPHHRVAVIGSGLVGIKTAQALAHRGLAVTLLARKTQVLSNLLDPVAADLLHRALARTGVTLTFGAVPAALDGGPQGVQAVLLEGGRRVPADIVIIGIGVTPNVGFLAAAGLSDPAGIAVNPDLSTAVPQIFAAGDCVQPADRRTGRPTYFAIWPAAVEQGRLAGAAMAGQPRRYAGLLPQNTLFVGGLRIIAGGVVKPPDDSYEVLAQHDPANGSYRRLVVHQGRLVGVILAGRVEAAGVYLQLIANQTPLASLPADPRLPGFTVGRLLG
jgi:NAD(P)H-nitrite reductase large subunit